MNQLRIILRKIVAVYIMIAVSFTVLPLSALRSYAAETPDELDEALTWEDSIAYSEAIYAPIISEYGRVFSGEQLNTAVMSQAQTGLENCQCGLCNMKNGHLSIDDDCSMDLYYSIADINHDGVFELIVADLGDDEYGVYSLWTNDGKKPVFLITSEYRSPATITTDGFIRKAYSGGWNTAGFSFYEISDTGLRKVAGASFNDGSYYPNDYMGAPASRQQYDEIMNRYNKSALGDLTWTRIEWSAPDLPVYEDPEPIHVSMTVYQVIKSGNTVYCSGDSGIYKVTLKKGKAVKVKRLVKTKKYTEVGGITKKGSYLYYEMSDSGTHGVIYRINVKTGKKSKLTGRLNDLLGYAVSGNKLYYEYCPDTEYDDEDDEDYYFDDDDDYYYDDDDYFEINSQTFSVYFDGSSEQAVNAVIKTKYKGSNARKYSVKTKYKGKYNYDYIKTPKGKKYLGRVKR